MTFLQNLGRDLVDKKLWPVAVALLLAAIAVPLLIGSGASSEDDVAVLPPPVAAAPAGIGDVSVAVTDTTKQRTRAGKARDPFKPLVYAKTAKTVAVAGAGATATPAKAASVSTPTAKASANAGGSGTAKAATPATVTPTTTTTTTTTKLFEYAVTLKTRRDGKTTTREAVRPISYVPSAAYPLLTFLGMKKGGETATFLVRDDVEVRGADRTCRPSRSNCQFLELQSGDDVLISKIPPAGQKTRHFRLIIGAITVEEVKPPTAGEAKSRAKTRAFRHVAPVRVTPLSAVTTKATTTG